VATISIQDARGYVQAIRNELGKRGEDVKFAFIILPTNQLKTYSDVKKICVLDYGIGCQCFLAKNMNRNDPKSKQKLGSICVKVAIQITAKLGGVPWGLKIPVKKLMVLGFDVYHCSERKGQSAGALVSTTDQTLTRYHSTVGFHKDKSELAHNLTASMLKSLNAYLLENNGALPDKVVLFRDGVGEGQINYVLDYEIPRLRQAIGDLYKDKEQEMAKLSVVIVTKKINSRALLQKSGHGGITYDNVGPGTVIDNTITLPERYDYFMVAQSVNQGTVSPTNYNVVLDESEFSPDHMQKLSYKLCHLYYNWCGTVAVPAPCQYAHKLAYLTGVALNNEAPQPLATTLWYL
jgi:aubergine-like protein